MSFTSGMETTKRITKGCWIAILPLLTFVYAGAVVESLWNWFIAPAVHGSDIGLSHALGILLLGQIFVVMCTHDIEKEQRWAGTRIVIAACVPEAKLASVVAALKAQEGTGWMNSEEVAKLIFLTGAGGIGWLISAFT